MKLHLPKQLFTALLAAIALAAPAALTVGSVSSAITLSENTEVTVNGTTYNATIVSGADNKSMNMGTNITLAEGSDIIAFSLHNGQSGNTAGNNWFDDTQTYAGNILIYDDDLGDAVEKGLIINNGGGNDVITFAGNVYGNGVVHKTSGVPSAGMTFKFTGDMSAFTGDIILDGNSSDKLIITGSTTGTGIIKSNGSITFNGATVYNSEVTTTLALNIGVDGEHSITTIGRLADPENDLSAIVPTVNVGTATISSGASLNILNGSLTSTGSFTNNGTLIVNSGASLVSNGTFTNAAGASITVDGNFTNSGTLVLNSTMLGTGTVTNSGVIKLGDYTLNNFANVTYVDGGTSGYVNSLTVFANTSAYTGSVYVGDTAYEVTEGNITLGGDDKTYYVNEDLTYDATTMDGATSFVVAEDKTLSLADFTVAVDTSVSFTFAGAGTTALSGTLTNSGTLTINGPVTLAPASTLNLAAGSDMVLNNAGTIILRNEQNYAEYKKVTGTGTLTIGNGTVIELANNPRPGATGAIEGSVVVLGGGKLLLSGANSLLGYNEEANDTTATDNVYLRGTNADTKATMEITSSGSQHLSTNLYLQGYAQVTGGSGTIETYYGKITATGTNNTIASKINVNRAITVEVTGENDALEISGQVYNGANAFTKTGQGSLTFTNAGTGNSKNSHGTYTNQAGITNINAAESSFTNYTNTAGETNINTTATITTLTQNGGDINIYSDSAVIGTLLQTSGTFTLQDGAELSLGTISSAVTMSGTGTLVLKGSVNYGQGLTFTSGVTELRNFTKAVSGTLALGSVDLYGSGLYMNSDNGSISAQSLGSVAAGAELIYGAGVNTNYLGNLTTQVTLNFYDVADQLSTGINLGFSRGDKTLEEVNALLTVNGLESESYTLSEQNGNVYLTSSSTLTSGWDDNWGGVGLAGKPTGGATVIDTLTDASKVAVSGEGTYYQLADTTAAAAELTVTNLTNAIVVGGYVTPAINNNTVSLVERNVWIRATSGTYAGIVGGNVTENYNGGVAADFEGATHILVDGATVGSIVGGNYRDAKSPTFDGNSYISVLSGNVTGSIFGGSVNGHNGTTTFNGDTHIFVYVPLDTNDTNAIDGSNLNNVIAGAGGKTRNDGGTNILNGNSHITIDLSGYTGDKTTFVKRIVGGYANWNSTSYTTTINGNTGIAITGKSGVSFTEAIVGGSYTAGGGTFTITGGTDVVVSSGEFSNSVVGGSYTTGAATTNTTSTKLTLNSGNYTGAIVGGDYSTSTGTKTVGATNVTIGGGSYSNVVAAGSYTTGAATTNTTSTSLTINGGTFTGLVLGGDYTSAASSNTVGTTSVTITGGTLGDANSSVGGLTCSPYNSKPVIAGGHLLNANQAGTTLNATSTNVTITGGSIGMDIFGGHIDRLSQSGRYALTATLGSATVTLNGANASVANIYGGSFTQRDNSNVTISQGNIVVDLIAGTVNGNVYAGGRQLHKTNLTTASTEVRISDGVTFTSGTAVVSGAYLMGCSSHADNASNNPSTVTGSKTLVFNGASQDRSGITFDSFDTIQVTEAASTVTLDTLTNFTGLNKTGAGTLTLNGDVAAATVTSAGGNLVLNGTIAGTGTYTANGGNITIGNLTVNEGVQLNLANSTAYYINLANGAIITNNGTISMNGLYYDSSDGDWNWNRLHLREFVNLINSIRGGAVVLKDSGGLNLQLGQEGPSVVDFQAKYSIGGELRLAKWNATASWNVGSDASLTVDGNLWLDHKQELNIEGGQVSATTMKLGYDTGQSGAIVNLSSGSLTTGTITLAGHNNDHSTAINMTGGELTFTNATVLSGQNKINISVAGGTLKATTSDWTLTGSDTHVVSLGNAAFDVAAGKTVTLAGKYDLTGTLTLTGNTTTVEEVTTTGTLALTGTMNVTDTHLLERGDGTYSGAASASNGFYSGAHYLVKNTDNAAISTTGLTVTLGGEQVAADNISLSETGNHLLLSVGSNGIFYVNSGEESALDATVSTAGYVRHHVESAATLTITPGTTLSAANAQNALLTTTGSGNITVSGDMTIAAGSVSLATGKLTISSGATLTMDAGEGSSNGVENKTHTYDLSSFTSVELDNGTIQYHGTDTTFNNVTVTSNGAHITFRDVNSTDTYMTLAGTTTLNGTLKVDTLANGTDVKAWKYGLKIESLSGSGALDIYSTDFTTTETARVLLQDISGFTGSISLTKASSPAILTMENLSGTIGLQSLALAGGAQATLVVNESAEATMATVISGNGSITKQGAGKLTLSGNSSYTGTTTISAGELALEAGSTLSSGAVTVSNGASLSMGDNAILSLSSGTSNLGSLTAGTGSKVNLGEEAILNHLSSVTGTLTLTGSGVYDLGSGTASNVSGLSAETWTGTVKKHGAGDIDQLILYANAGSTLDLSGVNAWISNNQTFNGTLVLTDNGSTAALSLDDGYSGTANATFSGTIEGTGRIDYIWNGGTSDITANHTFTADISDWSGKFVAKSTNKNVGLSFTKEGDVFSNNVDGGGVENASSYKLTVNIGSTDGDIDFHGTVSKTENSGAVELNVTHNNVTFNKTVNADKLTVAQGASAQLGNALTVGGVTFTANDGATDEAPAMLSANGSSTAIAQLAEGTSFSITDMVLTNTTVTAAAPTTGVSFSNVTVNGSFVLNVAAATTVTEPTVGAGGAESTTGTITYSYDLGLTSATAADNSITLNLDVLNAIAPSQSGQYTLVVELTNFDDSVFGSLDDATWKSLVGFQEGSWLAEAITPPTVESGDSTTTAPAVSYSYAAGTGSNVGTLTITITGLNVPEPTSATLGLAALMMLCARRRRRA